MEAGLRRGLERYIGSFYMRGATREESRDWRETDRRRKKDRKMEKGIYSYVDGNIPVSHASLPPSWKESHQI